MRGERGWGIKIVRVWERLENGKCWVTGVWRLGLIVSRVMWVEGAMVGRNGRSFQVGGYG